MNSRQRVLAAFDHQEPDACPPGGASVEFWTKAKRDWGWTTNRAAALGDDFAASSPATRAARAADPDALSRTIFGVSARAWATGSRSRIRWPTPRSPRSTTILADPIRSTSPAFAARRCPTRGSSRSSAATGRPSGTT